MIFHRRWMEKSVFSAIIYWKWTIHFEFSNLIKTSWVKSIDSIWDIDYFSGNFLPWFDFDFCLGNLPKKSYDCNMFVYYFDKHSQIGLRCHFNVTERKISDILVSVMLNAVNGRTEYKPLISNPHRNVCATYFRSKEVNQCIAVTEKSKKKPSMDETEKKYVALLDFLRAFK